MDMLPGPIFRRELKAAARPRSLLMMRTVLGLLLAGVLLLAVVGPRGWEGLKTDVHEPQALWTFGSLVFIAVFAVELVFAMSMTVTMVSPAVAEEREKDTLPLLLLTRLSRIEIILTKLFGRVGPSLSVVLVGLPPAAGCAWCAGVPALVLLEAIVMASSTVIVVGGFSILASARRDRVGTARAQAMAWAFIWFLMIPLCSIIPFKSGTVWGALAVELKRLCGWIAPSSPLSLATHYAWIHDRTGDAFHAQVAIMVALQVAMIMLAILGAASGLRLRERHAFSWDPYCGFRPPVGDDPLFWRKYTLPYRGARQPLIVIRARQVVILLRLIVISISQIAAMALAIAAQVGVAIATAHYGYVAFLELARDGYLPAGPTDARYEFNILIRAVTAVLAIVPIASLPAMTTGRVTIERDKKTWDGLLMTPLTGPEIMTSKMNVATRGLWKSARWLIPLWALGILVGSLHPLPMILAAVELPLATRAGLALGTWLGIRPGSALTTTANSHAAMASLGIGIVVGATEFLLLSSHSALAEFTTWDLWLQMFVIACLLTTPILLGMIALFLTRSTFRHFDEWVGRPYRKPVA